MRTRQRKHKIKSLHGLFFLIAGFNERWLGNLSTIPREVILATKQDKKKYTACFFAFHALLRELSIF